MTLVISKVFTYDTDAGNYIQAVEAADQTDTPGIGALEPAVRQAINNFVVGCKQDGIWDAIKVGCILAGAKTLEGSFIDLKSSTKLLTNNGPFADGTYVGSNYTTGDYNRKTGLVGDTSTKYINSNRANNADPQNSKHLYVYCSSFLSTGLGASLAGSSPLANGRVELETTTASFNLYGGGGAAYVVNSSLQAGGVGINRSNATEFVALANNVNPTIAANSSTPASDAIFIFRRNIVSPAQNFPGRLAFYSIGESLSLIRLNARVTDLINAFGAAIP